MDSKGRKQAQGSATQRTGRARRQEDTEEKDQESRKVEKPQITKARNPRRYSVQILEEKKMIPIHNMKMSGA